MCLQQTNLLSCSASIAARALRKSSSKSQMFTVSPAYSATYFLYSMACLSTFSVQTGLRVFKILQTNSLLTFMPFWPFYGKYFMTSVSLAKIPYSFSTESSGKFGTDEETTSSVLSAKASFLPILCKCFNEHILYGGT